MNIDNHIIPERNRTRKKKENSCLVEFIMNGYIWNELGVQAFASKVKMIREIKMKE